MGNKPILLKLYPLMQKTIDGNFGITLVNKDLVLKQLFYLSKI